MKDDIALRNHTLHIDIGDITDTFLWNPRFPNDIDYSNFILGKIGRIYKFNLCVNIIMGNMV